MMRLLVLFLLLFTAPLHAEMRILEIQGDPGAVQVVREGKQVATLLFAELQTGDEVRVTDPGIRVVLQAAEESLVVERRNSPFAVPEAKRPSVFDNVLSGALQWYQGLTHRPVDVVTITTRGDPEQPPRLQGLLPDENLLPQDTGLRVFWTNGSEPFDVELTSLNGETRVARTAAQSPVLLPTGSLHPDVYRILVVEGTEGEGRHASAIIRVVPAEALPEPTRDILASNLPESARQRLAALTLATDGPAWRFAALQLAAEAGDQLLVEALLEGDRPEAH